MYVRSYGTEREAEMVPVGLFASGSDLTWSGEWSRTMEQWLRIVSHVEHRLFPVDKTTAVRTRLCPLSPRCCWYTRVHDLVYAHLLAPTHYGSHIYCSR